MGKRHRDAVTVACDGQRTFRVFEDEVRVGQASTLDQGRHGDLAQLVDGSWLLGCRLSGGDVGRGRRPDRIPGHRHGRRRAGHRRAAVMAAGLVAARGGGRRRVVRPAAAADAVLRRQAAMRLELRSLSDGGSDDFGFTPPDGLPVVEEPERDSVARVGR